LKWWWWWWWWWCGGRHADRKGVGKGCGTVVGKEEQEAAAAEATTACSKRGGKSDKYAKSNESVGVWRARLWDFDLALFVVGR